MNYKIDLENANQVVDIQKAYEKELLRVHQQLKYDYPEDYIHRLILEHLTLWTIAEKTAIARFGKTENYWIRQKLR